MATSDSHERRETELSQSGAIVDRGKLRAEEARVRDLQGKLAAAERAIALCHEAIHARQREIAALQQAVRERSGNKTLEYIKQRAEEIQEESA